MLNKEAPGGTLEKIYFVFTAFLIIWFCQDLILSEYVPLFRDLGTYFYPLRFSFLESYRSGTLPLWDRHAAMGFPLMADLQSGAFYPPHLFFLIVPFFPAVRAVFLFHFFVAGLGVYCLCRSWKYPPTLSIIGALLFSFGGMIISLSNLLNHFQTAVWLPWVILSWEKLLRNASWKQFVTFTLILAIQFLAGSPELFTLTMALVMIDGIRVKVSYPRISYATMILLLVAANLLTSILVMIQLLPTAELFFQSRRQQAIPSQEVLRWSLKPLALLNLIFLDKEVDLREPHGLRLFFAQETPFLVSYYLGAICVFGISLWSRFSCIREKVTLISLVICSVTLSLGTYTPVYPFLLQHLSFLGVFRFPEKFFFFLYAVLLYMALKGLGALLTEEEGMGIKSFTALSFVGAVWLGLYLFFRFHVDFVVRFVTAHTGIPVLSPGHAEVVAAVFSNLERQVLLSLGFLLLLVLAKTKKIRPSLIGILLLSAVFIDLAGAHRGLLFLLSPSFAAKGDQIMRTPDADPARLFYYPSSRNLHPSSLTARGRPSFVQATALSFQNLLPNSGVIYGFDYMQEIDALARRPYTEFLGFANQLDPEAQIRLLRTFNVKYLVSFQPLAVSGTTLLDQFPHHLSWLYKIDLPIPRVYVVSGSIVEENSQRVLRSLASPDFNPLQEVVLNRSAGITPRGKLIATAKIGRYENQLVTVHASLNDSGILVLADSYYPGWNAYVDGKETEILKANHFFRAVPLSAGTHTVEFRYEPRSFAIGRAISILTLLSIVAISIFLYFRKRRQKLTAPAC